MARGEGETWLVFGDRGFIGAHIRQAAEAIGARVVGASRAAEADRQCDLGDRRSIEGAVAAVGPDRIINAAGPPSVARSWAEPAETASLHAVAAIDILEAARIQAPGAHLTFLSSAEVYGSSEADMSEDAPIQPFTPYGAAKAAMEIFCEQHRRAYGTEVAVLRLFNQIGPGLAPGHAIADFAAAIAAAAREGRGHASLTVGNLEAVRDYTDVRDCAEAIAAVAEQRLAGTYNLCSGRPTSTHELITALADAGQIPVDYAIDPSLARPSDPRRKVGRPDRLKAAIGWSAKTPLTQTITEILAAARLPGSSDSR